MPRKKATKNDAMNFVLTSGQQTRLVEGFLHLRIAEEAFTEAGLLPRIGTAKGNLLTVEDTAEKLNISVRSVQRMIARGKIAVIKVERSIRIYPADLAGNLDRMTDFNI